MTLTDIHEMFLNDLDIEALLGYNTQGIDSEFLFNYIEDYVDELGIALDREHVSRAIASRCIVSFKKEYMPRDE